MAYRSEYERYIAFWATVLIHAIRDMDSKNPEARANGADPKRFIFDNRQGPGTMRWICDALGVDADAVQQACMSRENRKKLQVKILKVHRIRPIDEVDNGDQETTDRDD